MNFAFFVLLDVMRIKEAVRIFSFVSRTHYREDIELVWFFVRCFTTR